MDQVWKCEKFGSPTEWHDNNHKSIVNFNENFREKRSLTINNWRKNALLKYNWSAAIVANGAINKRFALDSICECHSVETQLRNIQRVWSFVVWGFQKHYFIEQFNEEHFVFTFFIKIKIKEKQTKTTMDTTNIVLIWWCVSFTV